MTDERDKKPQSKSRISELEHRLGTSLLRPSQILQEIPDLTLEEMQVETLKWIDPFGEDKKLDPSLYETETFKETQQNLIRNFLQEALQDHNSRVKAYRLGVEWGIWKEEQDYV